MSHIIKLFLSKIMLIGFTISQSFCMESAYLNAPEEIHLKITESLPVLDIISLSRTCNKLYAIENDLKIWINRIVNPDLRKDLELMLDPTFPKLVRDSASSLPKTFKYYMLNDSTEKIGQIKICRVEKYSEDVYHESFHFLRQNVLYHYEPNRCGNLYITLLKPIEEIDSYLEKYERILSSYPNDYGFLEFQWLCICMNTAKEFIKDSNRCYDDNENGTLRHYWKKWLLELAEKSWPDAIYWVIFMTHNHVYHPHITIYHAETDNRLYHTLTVNIPFHGDAIPQEKLERYYEKAYSCKKFPGMRDLYIEFIENITEIERPGSLNEKLEKLKKEI